jgi:putative cofactor-binding repeat protein
MYKKFIYKFIITFGLLLCFTLLMPFSSYYFSIAMASQTVKEKEPEYWLNLKSNTLVTGKSFLLKAYGVGKNAKVSYKSDNPEIACVNNEGVVAAKKVGVTFITVTIKEKANSESLTCNLVVGPPAFSVKFTKSRIILGLNEVESLGVILKPSNTAETARYSSYDSSIASISYSGRITANKTGLTYVFAVIDATDENGIRKFAASTVIATNKDDTSSLKEYFNKHPELNLIEEPDLTSALDEFFNKKTSSAYSQVYSLNQFLDGKFKLDDLRKEWDDTYGKVSQ